MKHALSRLTIWALLAFLAPLPALAQAQTPAADGQSWQFHVAPYFWLSGLKGSVATLPGLPSADVNLKFHDIKDKINGALMLYGEARKGRWGLVGDVVHTDIETNNSTPGPFFSSVNLRNKNWMVSAAAFYRLIEQGGAYLDTLAGARFWSVETNLSLRAGLLRTWEVSHTENWVDPMVGFKGFAPLGRSKFFLSGSLLAGGFGLGSDFMWDASLNLGYQWTKAFSTTIGYRYLDVDYDQNDFKYDVVQQGMTMGLLWTF